LISRSQVKGLQHRSRIRESALSAPVSLGRERRLDRWNDAEERFGGGVKKTDVELSVEEECRDVGAVKDIL